MSKDYSENHEGWRADKDIFKSEKIESAVDRVINVIKEGLVMFMLHVMMGLKQRKVTALHVNLL